MNQNTLSKTSDIFKSINIAVRSALHLPLPTGYTVILRYGDDYNWHFGPGFYALTRSQRTWLASVMKSCNIRTDEFLQITDTVHRANPKLPLFVPQFGELLLCAHRGEKERYIVDYDEIYDFDALLDPPDDW